MFWFNHRLKKRAILVLAKGNLDRQQQQQQQKTFQTDMTQL
jgi:hypothetical protein